MLPERMESNFTLEKQSRIYVWDGVMMYVTQAHLSKAHAHFPALLQIGLGTTFAITLDSQIRSYHDIVVMAPNVRHSTDSENQPYIAVLIDPDHELYCYLHPLLNGDAIRSLPAAYLDSFHSQFQQLVVGHLSLVEAQQLLMGMLSALSPNKLSELPWDFRILQACTYIKQLVPQQIPTIAQVATHVGLSESRLMHLFSQQLGISMRRYILWLRIGYAIKLWVAGQNLIDIALEAGFSDQAHYTRTLRRMVDFAPSMLKAKAIFMCDATASSSVL